MAKKNNNDRTISFSKTLGIYGEKITGGVRIAVRAGGSLIENEAKANVMVANKPITYYRNGQKQTVEPGKLRDSIHIVDKTNLKNPKIYVVADAKNPVDGEGYGYILEVDPKRGRPFMYPAADKYRDPIKNRIIEEIQKAVRSR